MSEFVKIYLKIILINLFLGLCERNEVLYLYYSFMKFISYFNKLILSD